MSVLRTTANTERGSQYYVNTMTVVSTTGNTSDFYNEAGTGITIGDGDGLTVGLVLLRDMGKTVRLPVATGGGSFGIRTLRKVQRVTQAAVTTTNDGVIATAAASPQYGAFYISLGVNDAANTVRAVKFARLTIPN